MKKLHPERTANDITVVMRAAGVATLPVDVRTVALEISRAKYPDDPITVVKGHALPGLEGALSSAPPGKTGWGIFYNSAISSRGRINFTLGHEFGHYLLHRRAYPMGFRCSTEDLATWESEYAQRENEANVFAATLLMPLDDFRTQIDGHKRPDFDELGICATRYDVSLIAATLRWIQYTSRRCMLVVSRDGFVLWARSSRAAMRSRLYFRTRGRPPIEVPMLSLAANGLSLAKRTAVREFDSGAWLGWPCKEHGLLSEQYNFVLSLIHFADDESRIEPIEEQAENLPASYHRTSRSPL